MEYDNIKRLINDMGESKLSSLEIQFPDGTKISMSKEYEKKADNNILTENNNISAENVLAGNYMNLESKISSNNHSYAADESVENTANTASEESYRYIKSPMVGTFYSKPSPSENSFVEVGSSIKKGSTTCIIEAMKLMNEIESEFDGEVVEILKKDGDPVEYGENLIKLK